MNNLSEVLYFANFMYPIMLIVGFVILIKGADYLVNSAANIARAFCISPFIIGLSIVAFGTSAPEAAVGVFSAISNTNALSLGNVIGSNIANIALIVGIASILIPFSINKKSIKRELPMLILIQVILCVFILTNFYISRVEGIIFLVLFVGFLIYIFVNSKDSLENSENCENDARKHLLKEFVVLAIGILGLVFGADLVVDNASEIARMFNVTETIIGLTIVSIGTTLPEMVATITAVLKKEPDLAVGNIVGSNIFNILCVLGLSSTITPISVSNIFSFPTGLIIDMAIMLFLAIILFIILDRKNGRINRAEGIGFFMFYIAYLVFKVLIG